MLDAAYIREHLDDVKTNCKNRNVKADPERVVHLDDEPQAQLEQQTQDLLQRQPRTEVSKLIPKEKDAMARKQEKLISPRAVAPARRTGRRPGGSRSPTPRKN